jgi:hypothetical protein
LALIEENMELSHIHLAVAKKKKIVWFCIKMILWRILIWINSKDKTNRDIFIFIHLLNPLFEWSFRKVTFIFHSLIFKAKTSFLKLWICPNDHKNFAGTSQFTRSHCQSHHLLLQIKLELQARLIIYLFPRFHEQIYARLS